MNKKNKRLLNERLLLSVVSVVFGVCAPNLDPLDPFWFAVTVFNPDTGGTFTKVTNNKSLKQDLEELCPFDTTNPQPIKFGLSANGSDLRELVKENDLLETEFMPEIRASEFNQIITRILNHVCKFDIQCIEKLVAGTESQRKFEVLYNQTLDALVLLKPFIDPNKQVNLHFPTRVYRIANLKTLVLALDVELLDCADQLIEYFELIASSAPILHTTDLKSIPERSLAKLSAGESFIFDEWGRSHIFNNQ